MQRKMSALTNDTTWKFPLDTGPHPALLRTTFSLTIILKEQRCISTCGQRGGFQELEEVEIIKIKNKRMNQHILILILASST